MKIGVRKKRERKPAGKHENNLGISEDSLAGFLNLEREVVPEGHIEVETYALKAPFSYATVVQNEETGVYSYIVDELPLKKEESDLYFRMKNILDYELQAPEGDETLTESFQAQTPDIIDSHPKVFKGVSAISLRKILYYLKRDIV
ncbi:MAG: hypothetical protein NWE81_04205, partial [Candidatus Bathyarchaeota archaeon]|nr:hypothetical protein [Candidatus Bathyarchaeota archaeon]